MDFHKAVADNIKAIRERKKLTLDAAAAATGVSRSMLAQIEKGDANPTISVLWKIANGYKVSFTSLVDEPRREALVIRADEVTPLIEDDGRYINRPTFPFQSGRQFETYIIELLPQAYWQSQPHMAGTEEYITVFEGTVEIGAGDMRYRLDSGDSLRFDADAPHWYRCAGDKPARLHMLIFYSEK